MDEYQNIIKKRALMASDGLDFSEETPFEYTPPEDILKIQTAQPVKMEAPSAKEGGISKLSKNAGLLSAAGSIPSPASPYLLGAGLGLQAMGMIQQGKQADRDAKYRAEVQKANARQEALNRLSQIGQSLKI